MKREVYLFFTALMYYTRLPIPRWVPYQADYLGHSTRYFPVVGALVGAIAGGAFLLGNGLFSPAIGVLLAIAAGVWLTGGFHEDGFADACDGLAGGFTSERILTIMKDSRLGTFGALGLGLLVGGKFLFLSALAALPDRSPLEVFWALVAGHVLSRCSVVVAMHSLPYVQLDQQSKAKPIASTTYPENLWFSLVFSLGIGAVLGLVSFSPVLPLVLLPMALVQAWLGRLFQKRLGGYTGDLLGATQQLQEVVFYAGLLLLWKGIPGLP